MCSSGVVGPGPQNKSAQLRPFVVRPSTSDIGSGCDGSAQCEAVLGRNSGFHKGR